MLRLFFNGGLEVMKFIISRSGRAFTLVFLMLFSMLICAQSSNSDKSALHDYVLMTVSPADGAAVIKSPGGDMQVLTVGDALSSLTAFSITKILVGRVQLRDSENPDDTYFLYKSSDGVRSRVQRMSPKNSVSNAERVLIPLTETQ